MRTIANQKNQLNKIHNVTPVFKNEDTKENHILTLSGVVSEGGFFNDQTINAKDVREALDDVDKNIVIRLNSGGGDVFQGVEIYNYLKGLKSHVTVEITALAASAASLIAMAADKIVIRTGASMMVHEASTFAFGNKNDIQKTLNALTAIDESIIDIYAERTGLDREEIIDFVKSEKWFTASEAVKKGFADEKSSKKAVEESDEKGGVDNMSKDKIVALLKQNQSILNDLIEKEEDEPVEPKEPDETLEEKLDGIVEKLGNIDERVKKLEESNEDDSDEESEEQQTESDSPQNKGRKLYF